MKIKSYFAGNGAQFNDEDAKSLGAIKERLLKASPHHCCTPEDIVEAARKQVGKPNAHHKIDHLFEWDDLKAGNSYRKWQARSHISHLRIRVEVKDGDDIETRAVHSVLIKDNDNQRAYVAAETVATDADMRQQTLDSAWQELLRWKRRYDGYRDDFDAIFALIEETQETIAEEVA